MCVVFRLAACLDFALTLLKEYMPVPGIPLAGSHARQIALIFGAAFLITEFGAAWHILWRGAKYPPIGRRLERAEAVGAKLVPA